MSRFTPDPCKTKNNRKTRTLKQRRRLERQRAEYDYNASRPYRIIDTTRLTLSIRPLKAGMIKTFMILLDAPLPKREVEERIDNAFGDLNVRET